MVKTEASHAFNIGSNPVRVTTFSPNCNAPYQCTTSLHPISEVANLEKKVPLEWVNADHTAMLPEFLAYAMPLIQAELTPIYVEGLPHHIYLPET